MTETPDHETFDLIAAVQGINYPEDTVEVYFDESLMFHIHRSSQQVDRLFQQGLIEEAAALTEEIDKLRDSAQEVKYTFHLRAVPRELNRAMFQEINKEFPEEVDFLQRPVPNPERNEAFADRHWALHITKVVNPAGAITTDVTPGVAKVLRNRLPGAGQTRIENAIESLYSDSKKGYEDLIKDVNFLSGASPEA